MERTIIHLNIADFGVVVERLLDTSLKQKALIIAEPSARSVVYDMSEEAYGDGVRKGMQLGIARNRCRRALVFPPRPEQYQKALGLCIEHALHYTPLVERSSGNGHLYLDVTGTGRLFGPPPDIGWRLRNTLLQDIGLYPIWSVAPNKLLAKVASRVVKPSGEYIVADGEEAAFLAPLPLALLPGISAPDLMRLRNLNIHKVCQAAALSVRDLGVVCGRRAEFLHNTLRGVDPTPVRPAGGSRPDFTWRHDFSPDTNEERSVRAALASLVQQAGYTMRSQGLGCRQVMVHLLYTDGVGLDRQAGVKLPLCDDIALEQLAVKLLYKAWQRRVRLRRIALVCSRLCRSRRQLPLFETIDTRQQKNNRISGAFDAIRNVRVPARYTAWIAAADARCIMICLGLHSHFSLMQGTASPRTLCRQARRMGYSTLALTDINNLYGLWAFLAACKEEKLTPIPGAEIRTDTARLFCLVKDRTGYRNLCRLLTERHCNPAFHLQAALSNFHEGMILLVPEEHLLRHCRDIGADMAAALVGQPDQHNSRLRQTALGLHIPAVAMGNTFFISRDDYPFYRLLRAIDTNSSLCRLSPAGILPAGAHLIPPDELARRFRIWPDCLAQASVIAEKCCFGSPRAGLIMPPWGQEDRTDNCIRPPVKAPGSVTAVRCRRRSQPGSNMNSAS